MAFTYLTNVPLEQAKKDYLRVLAEQGFSARTERIRVQDAFGRITAKAVYAHINAPHYACSAMDGIALFAKDSFGATETTPVTLREGQFTVVDTGDPIPEGCDAVIMVEEIVRNEDGSVTIHAPAAPWQHVRQIGEDVCAGGDDSAGTDGDHTRRYRRHDRRRCSGSGGSGKARGGHHPHGG